jgi:hypothetical protein
VRFYEKIINHSNSSLLAGWWLPYHFILFRLFSFVSCEWALYICGKEIQGATSFTLYQRTAMHEEPFLLAARLHCAVA